MTPVPPPPPPRPRRLAVAARSCPAPVYLRTGHFAPPNQYAVWHLPTSAANVVCFMYMIFLAGMKN